MSYMANELARERADALASNFRSAARLELFASIALALSTLIAVTAVSIGLARAEMFGSRTESETATLAIALLIGLLLAGMGGLTAIMSNHRPAE